MVLAAFPEGRKDSARSKWIGFYKRGNEVFTVICMIEFKLKVSFFAMMQVCFYPSLMFGLFGPAVRSFRFTPSAYEDLAGLSPYLYTLFSGRYDVFGTLRSPTIRHRRYSLMLKKTTINDLTRVGRFILPNCERYDFLISLNRVSL